MNSGIIATVLTFILVFSVSLYIVLNPSVSTTPSQLKYEACVRIAVEVLPVDSNIEYIKLVCWEGTFTQ